MSQKLQLFTNIRSFFDQLKNVGVTSQMKAWFILWAVSLVITACFLLPFNNLSRYPPSVRPAARSMLALEEILSCSTRPTHTRSALVTSVNSSPATNNQSTQNSQQSQKQNSQHWGRRGCKNHGQGRRRNNGESNNQQQQSQFPWLFPWTSNWAVPTWPFPHIALILTFGAMHLHHLRVFWGLLLGLLMVTTLRLLLLNMNSI